MAELAGGRVSASVEIGDVASFEVRLYIYADVLEELAFAAGYRDGGMRAVLVGERTAEVDGAQVVEVSGFAALQYVADAPERDVVEAWQAMCVAAGERGEVVGLCVARDGGHGQLDDEDMLASVLLGSQGGAVVVVLDATHRRLGCYGRPPGRTRFLNVGLSVIHALDHPADQHQQEE